METIEHQANCACGFCADNRRQAVLLAAKELPSARRSAADCVAWIDPDDRKPEFTGKYLVWTSEGLEVLRIEETFMEYSDGTSADWDEIQSWAYVSPPNARAMSPATESDHGK